MKILVTGGAGFLGSHLCDRLIERGDSVVCVDNFFTGQRRNIAHLLDHPRFQLIEHDIIEPLTLDVDQIYNLACPASPIHYQHNPIRTVKANTVGMINMLGLAKRTGARILQASTSEVYGDPDIHPQTEAYVGHVNCLGPRACYDEGKRIAETLCMDYHRHNKVDIRIVRIFNTYGPRMHPQDGRVVSNFIMQALNNEDITLYGDGSQTRSFCYVDDLIAAIIAMMDQTKTVGPINIGNPDEMTIKELAEKIIEITGSKSTIVFRNLPADDPKQRQPDITLAKQALNWQPTTNLQEGLKNTIDYFRKNKQNSLV
ncbi:MAG: UDP-glucuronic acid decarboxylase family protein [Candidatus Andersenbacteria bacterium]|nr:SDR family oxidoreductase [bacterium]MDZ4225255.1 UDP-glucuronic acid decarboxylase family protein [Candidatus Andersenbacteria bacterium]